MKVDFPKEPFTDIEPFKEWYYEQAAKNVQGSVKGNLTLKLPRWTEEEKKYVFQWCRAALPFPKKVLLMYAPNAPTLYSYYNESKNKFVIALTTSFYLITAFPDAAKAGVQHEFGHILNGDCIRYLEPKYRSISNEVYDVAINANIQRTDIDNLYNALFDLRNGCPNVPDIAYPKWSLPINETGWSFEVAMDAALEWKNSQPDKETFTETPIVGDIIRVGDDFGRVTKIEGSEVTTERMDKQEAIDFLKRMKKVFDGDADAMAEAIETGYINVIKELGGQCSL